ncbi:MAG: GerMN domain-containing protein [Desulfobacteraceae bacterium]|nr:GerMN domain-containing protein [Desulfobacteraceae bacterium]MBC2755562.1 GerMN domain-containing protein [Desulfobacteraceae bacterium]
MIHKVCVKNKHVLIIAGMVCLWLFSAVDLHAINDPVNNRKKKELAEEQVLKSFSDSAADFPVYLYFADNTNQYLLGEERPGLGSDDPVVFCRQIINALIQGSLSGLARTIPATTELRAIYIDDKTAYVDLTREVTASHPGGIVSELMTIYAIVNTLVLNVDGVDQVKILIEGQEAETLSGHIDIRFPLNADMLLIR